MHACKNEPTESGYHSFTTCFVLNACIEIILKKGLELNKEGMCDSSVSIVLIPMCIST